MSKQELEPAFPFPTCSSDGACGQYAHGGMSLRDYFAAKAMASLIAKFPLLDADGEYGGPTTREANGVLSLALAESSYCFADAMLEARK